MWDEATVVPAGELQTICNSLKKAAKRLRLSTLHHVFSKTFLRDVLICTDVVEWRNVSSIQTLRSTERTPTSAARQV